MKFDERWNHGPRLVFRRIYEFFVGPSPSIHFHTAEPGPDNVWHWFPIVDPFVKWQDPKTTGDGGRWHFDKCGLDLILGPWTLCLHWIDH